MSTEETIYNLAKRYESSSVIRGLIQLIPFGVGSAFDVVTAVKFSQIREERIRVFFDEIASGSIELTPEVIESEEFLHAYFSTLNAVTHTHRKEKIKLFAKLLTSTLRENLTSKIDEYEEFLKILEELSYREFVILTKLESYEDRFPKRSGENDLQRVSRFWDDFSTEVKGELQIQSNELDASLTRLNRTGCYETFTGAFLSYTGGKGKLTPIYYRLKSLLVESTDAKTEI